MTDPVASRPVMPGYGIAEDPTGVLPWSWAEERLASSRNYWVATTNPDGTPHLMPVWAVYSGGALYFSTAVTSRKARNLLQRPSVSISTEHGDEPVILQGEAIVVTDAANLGDVWTDYKAKYNWDLTGESMFVLRPRLAFAFIEAADDFFTTATRWRFD
jgi:hypothetical protein